MAPQVLAACGLPGAWAKCSAWTVLDTDFQGFDHFLNIWQAWQHDPDRPRMLHYVVVTDATPERAHTHRGFSIHSCGHRLYGAPSIGSESSSHPCASPH